MTKLEAAKELLRVTQEEVKKAEEAMELNCENPEDSTRTVMGLTYHQETEEKENKEFSDRVGQIMKEARDRICSKENIELALQDAENAKLRRNAIPESGYESAT